MSRTSRSSSMHARSRTTRPVERSCRSSPAASNFWTSRATHPACRTARVPSFPIQSSVLSFQVGSRVGTNLRRGDQFVARSGHSRGRPRCPVSAHSLSLRIDWRRLMQIRPLRTSAPHFGILGGKVACRLKVSKIPLGGSNPALSAQRPADPQWVAEGVAAGLVARPARCLGPTVGHGWGALEAPVSRIKGSHSSRVVSQVRLSCIAILQRRSWTS